MDSTWFLADLGQNPIHWILDPLVKRQLGQWGISINAFRRGMGLTIYVSSICSNRIFHSKPSSYLGIPGYVPPWLTNPPNVEWLVPRTLRLFMLLVALDTLLYWLLEWLQPASEVADCFGVVWRVWCWSWMLAKSMKSKLLWDTMYLLCTNTVILMVGLKFDSNAGPDGLGCATLEIQRPRWQCRGTMKWNAKESPELSWYSHRRWSSGHPGHPPPKNLF